MARNVPRFHDGRQLVRRHVGNVARPRAQTVDLRLIDVVADDVQAGFRKLDGERQSDISEPDDADAGFPALDALQQIHCHALR